MPDNDNGDDSELADALNVAQRNVSGNARPPETNRVDNREIVNAPNDNDTSGPARVQQPKPQALPSRSGPSSILVSTRQKGNPILNSVRTVPWEYSDIPADYILGATTCALFLSLKYHRLHPEYIYNRIQKLRGLYNLRILLTMVDIQNHEESLKELSKTSVINNVTVVLCWSAQEAGRYLELFKTYEHAAPTSIRAHQSSSYSDKLVDFITVPRSINKTDAVGLVSNFGSVRTAVNAQPEEIALIAGWGEKKVQRWCNSVREPFRARKAAKRRLGTEQSNSTASNDRSTGQSLADSGVAARLGVGSLATKPVLAMPETSIDTDEAQNGRSTVQPKGVLDWLPTADEEEAMTEATLNNSGNSDTIRPTSDSTAASVPSKRKPQEEELSEGVMAALAKLRKI